MNGIQERINNMTWANVFGWFLFTWASLSVVTNLVKVCITKDDVNLLPQLAMYFIAIILIGR